MAIDLTLQNHITLCDETYSLMLEENKILKETGSIPEGEFLKRKQNLLLRLDASVEAIKELNLKDSPNAYKYADLIKTAQKKLMKISLLDRENEQLFLKCNAQEHIKLSSRPKTPERIRALYKNEPTPISTDHENQEWKPAYYLFFSIIRC